MNASASPLKNAEQPTRSVSVITRTAKFSEGGAASVKPVQLVLPVVKVVPGQEQVRQAVFPVVSVYWPLGQPVQGMSCLSEYVPAAQGAQLKPSPELPGKQVGLLDGTVVG